MKTILTIAKWEVLRLRSRFGGKSKVVIWPILIVAIVLSITIYHQDFNLSKGIYTIGIESGGPIITDSRFISLTLDPWEGSERLKNHTIDLYLTGNSVLMRNDERSQYAAGALKKYLENLELNRIAAEYPVNQAFPLRITIGYLDSAESATAASALSSETEILSLEKAAEFSGQTAELESSRGTDGTGSTGEYSTGSYFPPVTGELPESEVSQWTPAEPTPGDMPEAVSSPSMTIVPAAVTPGDAIVSSQLDKWQSSGALPEFKAEFASENEVIVPSLMTPPMPLSQVIIAFLYIVPMFFISVFFTSSFTEEKVNRKLVILLSSPVTRLQVMFGKMLPYYVYSILVIIGVTLLLHGNLGLALAIFLPVMLFIFSVYLMVALTYRTFKDQTFFSVLALSVITVYLVVPAMFAGVSDLSYISPLSLAVQMYRGETITISQYLIATLPLYLIFFMAIYVGRRVFNEEFLMGFKPLRIKVVEAIYLSLNQRHLNLSIFVLNLLLIPVVFAFQLVAIVIVSNLPSPAILGMIMVVSIIIEEIAKSLGILALIRHQAVSGFKQLVVFAALAALGFWLGEKILLLLAANMSAESDLVSLFLGSSRSGLWLYIVPLALHFGSTLAVGAITAHRQKRGYLLGIAAGSLVHVIYNFVILFATGAFR